MLTEWEEDAGSLGGYFYQDQLVARWIHELNPSRHVDVGSRIDGFIGHLSVFREVEVLDIRPLSSRIPNVTFHQLDLMESLPERWLECTDSLSCLHTVEHFGLGRYGDRLDPIGHERGVDHLQSMVKPGGRLYLSVPIGPERLEFNAHRVFAIETLLSWFQDGWDVERLAIIDDVNQVIESVDLGADQMPTNFGCNAGVGILVAKRRA